MAERDLTAGQQRDESGREAEEKRQKDEKRQQEAKPSIAENFESLERIIARLESGEVSLEDSFKYYEQGMKLVKSCKEQIDRVEKKIRVLAEEDESDEQL